MNSLKTPFKKWTVFSSVTGMYVYGFHYGVILGVFPLVSTGNCPILQALLGNMSLIVQILYFSDIILRDLK